MDQNSNFKVLIPVEAHSFIYIFSCFFHFLKSSVFLLTPPGLAWRSGRISLCAEVYIPCGIPCCPLGMLSLNLQVAQSLIENALWDTLTPAIHKYSHLHSACSQIDALITYVIISVLKWTKPQALSLDVCNGTGWLTARLILLTKRDTARDTRVSWDTNGRVCVESQTNRISIDAKYFVSSRG